MGYKPKDTKLDIGASVPAGEPDRSEISLPAILTSPMLRELPDRSKGSMIGTLVCPVTDRLIHSESNIEHRAVLHCYHDRAVKTVRTQAVKISYPADGADADHYVDVLAATWDRQSRGLVVKHSDKAAKMRLSDFVEYLAAHTDPSVVTALEPFTERDLPEFHVANARLFYAVRDDVRTYYDDLVREAAPAVKTPITIREFMEPMGGGRFAFRPVARAIFWGTLDVVSAGKIDPDSMIAFSGTVMPDLDEQRRNPLPR